MSLRRVLAGLICVCSMESMMAANAAFAQEATLQPICTGSLVQAAMPTNIRVVPHLEPVVARLLNESDTFKRQCARVAMTSLVRIDMVVMSVRSSLVRARGQIRKTADGRIEATIEIPICRDAPELVVHELEHVIEQMDGLDLAALARARHSEVRLGADGFFETERARRAGEAAAAELEAFKQATAGPSPGRRSWLALIR